MREQRRRSTVWALGLAAIAALWLVGPAAGASLAGDAKVTPGKRATFTATGFSPGAALEVSIAPTINRGGNCCGDRVGGRVLADESGGARITFTWPRTYTFCAGSSCSRYPWGSNERADVRVLQRPADANPDFIQALRVVRVAGPPRPRVARDTQWQTPSKNIACALYNGELTCEIHQSRVPPRPRPASCNLDWGNRFSMTAAAHPKGVCYGGVLVSRPATLPYGSTWSRGAFRCTVKRTAVRCVNRARHGWMLARERIALF